MAVGMSVPVRKVRMAVGRFICRNTGVMRRGLSVEVGPDAVPTASVRARASMSVPSA